MLRYDVFDTAWGPFATMFSREGLKATLLPDAYGADFDATVAIRWPGATYAPGVAGRLRRRIQRYFEGQRVAFDVALDLSDMTCFRQSVLEACHRVPYGRIASYRDLARAAGRPDAMRAVGSTMAHNPLPLIVPCHRVICADGTLGGFSSRDGVAMKLRMLELEGTTLPAMA